MDIEIGIEIEYRKSELLVTTLGTFCGTKTKATKPRNFNFRVGKKLTARPTLIT